jgi:glucokinase
VERAARTALELLADGSEPLLASAAVLPGLPRPEGVLLAPNLPGWDTFPFAARLAEELGVEAIGVANDVRAGALAEVRFGALRDTDPGVYVNLGTGLAACVVVGGEVVAGAHGAAGEIAYMSAGTAFTGEADRAPLEDLAGGNAISAAASALLHRPLSAAEVFASSDPVASHVAMQAAGAIAAAVSDVAVLIDPQTVALGGGLMGAADVLLPIVRARVEHAVPFPPDVVPARFTYDASLYGAIALAVDAAGSYLPSTP